MAAHPFANLPVQSDLVPEEIMSSCECLVALHASHELLGLWLLSIRTLRSLHLRRRSHVEDVALSTSTCRGEAFPPVAPVRLGRCALGTGVGCHDEIYLALSVGGITAC
jgi:hypothetical protein